MTKRKAEMWDKMQYLFRNYYDRMVHTAVKVKGKIDFEILAKALNVLVEKIDILRCSFAPNALRPHWQLNKDYDAKEFLTLRKVEDIDKAIDEVLCEYIDVEDKYQLRVNLLESEEESAITLIVNHMCSDGGDCKYILGKIAELYNDISAGNDGSRVQLKQGRRDAMQLYDRLPPEKLKQAKKLYKNISQSKINVKFPFAAPSSKDVDMVRLYRTHWEKDFVEQFNVARKRVNATVNDVLLAAFFRKLYAYLDGSVAELNIVSMMDLRRYCGGETLGVTNMTGFAPCDITMENEPFLSTLEKVKIKMEQNKADEFMGMYSLPLLRLAFLIFPHFISEFAIKLGYQNPLIGMSNIGIIDKAKCSFIGTEPVDAFMTGASKYKPYMQLTATTFEGTMTFCIAEKCNERDGYILSQFLQDFKKELDVFINEACKA